MSCGAGNRSWSRIEDEIRPDIRDLQKRVKLLEALVIELAVAAAGKLK